MKRFILLLSIVLALNLFMVACGSTEVTMVWSEPVNICKRQIINMTTWEYAPWLSEDMLTMFFVSKDRPGGYGESDIWMATRDSIDSPWSKPMNLGPSINTKYGEYTPWICSDGVTLFFDSDRPEGSGKDDIWMSLLEIKDK